MPSGDETLAGRLAAGVIEEIGQDPVLLLGDDPELSRHLDRLSASEVDRIRTESLVFVMFTAVAVALTAGVSHEILTDFHTRVYRHLVETGILATPEEVEGLNTLANDRYGGYYETLAEPMSPEPVDDLGMAAAMLVLGTEHTDLLFRVRGGLSGLFLRFGATVKRLAEESSRPS